MAAEASAGWGRCHHVWEVTGEEALRYGRLSTSRSRSADTTQNASERPSGKTTTSSGMFPARMRHVQVERAEPSRGEIPRKSAP